MLKTLVNETTKSGSNLFIQVLYRGSNLNDFLNRVEVESFRIFVFLWSRSSSSSRPRVNFTNPLAQSASEPAHCLSQEMPFSFTSKTALNFTRAHNQKLHPHFMLYFLCFVPERSASIYWYKMMVKLTLEFQTQNLFFFEIEKERQMSQVWSGANPLTCPST